MLALLIFASVCGNPDVRILLWKLAYLIDKKASCKLLRWPNMLYIGVSRYFEANFEILLLLFLRVFSICTIFYLYKSKSFDTLVYYY